MSFDGIDIRWFSFWSNSLDSNIYLLIFHPPGGLLKNSCFYNLFSTNIPFLYLLKTLENCRFSDVFRGYRSEALAKK